MEKRKETVLIVDDDELSRERIKHVFSKEADYGIAEADSGRSALALMGKSPVDIILLDVDMPGQNGFEVCREIRSIQKFETIPVIFITGDGDIEAKAKGFEAGGNDYITKPIVPKEVRIRVQAHLRIKQAEELKMVKDMIATYNHNMNQPLTTMYSYIEILLEKYELSDEAQKILKKMKSQFDKINAILKKIQSIDKVKRTDYVEGSEMVDLNATEQPGE